MGPRRGLGHFKPNPKVSYHPTLFNSKLILFNRTMYKGNTHSELSLFTINFRKQLLYFYKRKLIYPAIYGKKMHPISLNPYRMKHSEYYRLIDIKLFGM